MPARRAADHAVVIAGSAKAPTENPSMWNRLVPMKANHGSSPSTSTLSAIVSSTLSVAAPKARQCLPASRANGTSTPKCGFTLAKPISTPAHIGRLRSSSKPDPSRPAVRNPVCPYITLKNAGGAASAKGRPRPPGRILRRVSR